jgi:hypothetical protein
VTDQAATLARVKALALSACIQAGGKPCWVAAHAADDSPAASPITPMKARKPSLAPQYRPRRSPPATSALSSAGTVPPSSPLRTAPLLPSSPLRTAPLLPSPETAVSVASIAAGLSRIEIAWLRSAGRVPGRPEPAAGWPAVAAAAASRCACDFGGEGGLSRS